MQYAELAHLKDDDDDDAAARNASAGNAVLAGIAAADTICLIKLGQRSASPDHGEAIILLRDVDSTLAKHLSVLIGDKPTAHYGGTFLSTTALKSCVRAMERLIEAATTAMQS